MNLIKTILILNLLSLAFVVKASATSQKNCFVKHIKDAISINRKRRPLYENLTDGKSKKISNELILMEKLIYPMAYVFDKRARKYQKKGIAILCNDLVDMSEISEFSNEIIFPSDRYEKIKRSSVKEMKEDMKDIYHLEGWEGLAKYTGLLLHDLNKSKSYNCLLRHFIESINRTAHLAPNYIDKANRLGLKSPKKLLWDYTKFQIFGLSWGISIDSKASKIQSQGVPILCQDVPAIHAP